MLDIPALDGGHLPRQGDSLGEIAGAGRKVKKKRSRRDCSRSVPVYCWTPGRPAILPVDDKELAGWNGLMLAACQRLRGAAGSGNA